MRQDANDFWKQVSLGLRHYLKFSPPTREEAEEEFSNAQEVPLSQKQIQTIFQYATTGKRESLSERRFLPEWLKGIDLSEVSQEMVLALARNAGARDEEVEELLARLRQDVLKDEEQANHVEDPTTLQDKAESGEESE